ncbi:MAG: YegS/Rv2252/BmrU family lipid kinase, partial [Clostridia bacterium]|nr:YegS/Rv2252/BmrU family lipid kinase [Clostridia bacterium]
MKKLLFIVNPTAGKKKIAGVLSEILQIFCAHGYAPTVLMTEKSGHAVELCRDNAKDYELVACAGGDGTLNETINGLLDSGADVPVAYLPCGTTNDLANTLGLSANLLSAAKDAVEGGDMNLDIGSFNGRNFVYTASFGAFTKASYGTPQSVKNALGHMAYVLEGVKQLGSLKPTHVKVTTDKEELEGDYLFGS